MPSSWALLGAMLLGKAVTTAFVPTPINPWSRHVLIRHYTCRHRRAARPVRLVPLAVSKKDKAIQEEEKRRVRELAASQLKAERAELKLGLEAALNSGDGSKARRLLREAERGANPALAQDPELVSIAMRAYSKGGRHADVIALHGLLGDAGGSIDGDRLALIAAASTGDWARAEQLLEALLAAAESTTWTDDDFLRSKALATAEATGNSKAAAQIFQRIPSPTSDEASVVLSTFLNAGEPQLAMDLYDQMSGGIQLDLKAHEQALESLTMMVAESEPSTASRALAVLDTIRGLENVTDTALPRCIETVLNLVIASETASSPSLVDLAEDLFDEADEDYEPYRCSAATVSAMIVFLYNQNTWENAAAALQLFERSYFAEDAASLTVEARVCLVEYYGMVVLGGSDPYNDTQADAFGQDVWGPRARPYDSSIFFGAARRVLKTLRIDSEGIFDATTATTVWNVSINERNTEEYCRFQKFNSVAISALASSSEDADVRLALELLLMCETPLIVRPETLLNTWAVDPSRARWKNASGWGLRCEFLSLQASQAKAQGVQLSQDVCHRLLFDRELFSNSRMPDWMSVGATAYFDMARDLHSLCLDDGGLTLDAWYLVVAIASVDIASVDEKVAVATATKLIDSIANEASSSKWGLRLYDGKSEDCIWIDGPGSMSYSPIRYPGIDGAVTPVNLWDWMYDVAELWRWECFIAKAQASTIASLNGVGAAPTWFKPSEGSELAEILQTSAELDGFLRNFHFMLTVQCRRWDVLEDIIGFVADGKYEYEVHDGSKVDLFGRKLLELLLEPSWAGSPLATVNTNAEGRHVFHSIPKSIDPVEVVASVYRVKPGLTSLGLGDELADWVRRVTRRTLTAYRAAARETNSDNSPPDFVRVASDAMATGVLIKTITEKVADAELRELLSSEVVRTDPIDFATNYGTRGDRIVKKGNAGKRKRKGGKRRGRGGKR